MYRYTHRNQTIFYEIKAETLQINSSVDLPTPKLGVLAILKIYKDHISWNTNGNNYNAFNGVIETLNNDGTKADAFVNNFWKFEVGKSIKYRYRLNNEEHFLARFTDPYKLSKSEAFNISAEGFIDAYKRFLELSKFHNYEDALNNEKNILVVENAVLKNKVQQLEIEIEKLTNQSIK